MHPTSMITHDSNKIEWRLSKELVPYKEALEVMEARVDAIARSEATEMVWLLEHPPLYTLGTSTKEGDLLQRGAIPVYESGRGGRSTYHGPGQRVVYVMLDLKRRAGPKGPDIRAYVKSLEDWVITTLSDFQIPAHIDPDNVGVWVNTPNGSQDKIAAIGIRVRKWVTFHGIAINVAPNLNHYQGIIPCGLAQRGVTSFEKLGVKANLEEIDRVLKKRFDSVF